LAVNQDIDFEIAEDQNSDLEDMTSFWIQLNRLALPEPETAPSIEYAEISIEPPPDPNLAPDCARAPPIYL